VTSYLGTGIVHDAAGEMRQLELGYKLKLCGRILLVAVCCRDRFVLLTQMLSPQANLKYIPT
jgi:hypothetical protein